MILANHGLLCAGRTIPEAFSNIYYLERACQAQVAALVRRLRADHPAGGGAASTRPQQFNREATLAHYDFMWESCLRLIEDGKPDYRS